MKGTLTWLLSLAVLSAAQHESSPQNCSSQLMENLSADLQMVVECGDGLSSAVSAQQRAAVLLSMRTLTDALHTHQLKDCQAAEPQRCPEAQVPDNGGLACVTVADTRYCKPLCNHGYDFGFLRRGRLYEECSEQRGYRWSTQYVAGNTLAVCNKAPISVSGEDSAYFRKDQDCLTTKSSSPLLNSTIEVFTSELKGKGIQGEPQYACLVCGGT